MPQLLSASESESLKLTSPLPLTLHPAAVYLDSLGKGSKLTMTNSLNTIASILTEGKCDALTLDWSKLRYRHTSIVRSVLEKRVLFKKGGFWVTQAGQRSPSFCLA